MNAQRHLRDMWGDLERQVGLFPTSECSGSQSRPPLFVREETPEFNHLTDTLVMLAVIIAYALGCR